MFIFIWLHNIRQYKQPPGGREAVGQFRSDLYDFVGLFFVSKQTHLHLPQATRWTQMIAVLWGKWIDTNLIHGRPYAFNVVQYSEIKFYPTQQSGHSSCKSTSEWNRSGQKMTVEPQRCPSSLVVPTERLKQTKAECGCSSKWCSNNGTRPLGCTWGNKI